MEQLHRQSAELTRAITRTAQLQELTLCLGDATTEHEITEVMLTHLATVVCPDASLLYLLERGDDGREWLEMAGSGGLTSGREREFARLPLDGDVPVCEVVRGGTPVFLGCMDEFHARFPRWPPTGLRLEGFVAIPLLGVRGARHGAVVFGFRSPREFSEDVRRHILALVHQGAQAFERARLLTAERRARADAVAEATRVRELQMLTEALSGALTPDDVATVALERARPAFGAAAGLFNLVSDDGTEFISLRTYGFASDVLSGWRRYPVHSGTPGEQVLVTGTPVYVETLTEGIHRFPSLADAIQRAGYPAFACLPLVYGGRTLGIVSFNFADARAFTDAVREQMRAFAGQCALAVSRARLYEAERAARAEAEVANLAKMQFLATMSHELRTPLNAIAGYVDLMELGIHGPVTEEQRNALGRIRRSEQHLLSLINEVLNHARLEAGAVRYDFAAVRVAGVLASVESLVQPQVLTKGLTLVVDDCDPALAVRADAEKLNQVLLNLLSNAIKFTSHGGRVTITCDAHHADSRVAIAVHDTGIGIPADQLERVFEPFVQVGRTYSSPHEGTGLGLAISRDLARGMGGELTAASTPDEGSTFTLTLPIA
jgi:signal transduction histidine kinase